MNKFSELFKKLKSVKHIEIILAVLFGLIILLVYFSSTSSKDTYPTENYTSTIEYKMENLLSKINGAGKVNVMVMSDGEEKNSKIISAVIVSSGASDAFVKLEIIKAVEALLGIKTANIEVITGGG